MRGAILALALLTGAAGQQAQNLTGVKAVAARGNISFALLSDGTVWCWGQNSVWEEVFGGGETRPVPWWDVAHAVAISPPLTLKADGTVWAYSLDSMYALNSNGLRVPELSGVVAVASGGYSNHLALTRDGIVWELGSPLSQAGIGKWYGSVTRVGGVSEISAIAAGARNSLALKRDGTVWMWGDNLDGSLGDGLTPVSSSVPYGQIPPAPVQATGLDDVVAIAAGYGHNLALKRDGTVWAWGSNGHGQLGDGTTETRAAPIQVSGLGGAVRIAAGDAHSVAVKSDGTVWTWGSNVGGQLGDGTTTDRLTPVQVSGLSGITGIAAGHYHTLALNQDGTVHAWGVDQFGQLGDAGQLEPGPNDPPIGPVQVGALAGVTKIAAGTYHSLALMSDGTLWAWGYQTMGQTADGRTRGLEWPDWSTPVKLSGLAGVASMAGTLAVTIDGAVWDWGGAGGAAPARVSGLSGVVSVTGGTSLTRDFSADLSSYSETYCHMAVREDGTVWEWGIQYPRSNGWRMDPVRVGPTPIAGLADVRMVAASEIQNVVLKRDGTVWEWGRRGPSPPWSGYPEPRPSPVPVSGLTDVVSVAVFNYRSLALKRDGTVWAWGNSNYFGELGDGTTTNRTTPVQVAGLNDVVAIDTRADGFSVGVPHSVALKRDGTVWEWPTWGFEPVWAAKSLTPVQVPSLTDIVAVAEGGGHSLALKRDGTVWAWGQNIYGQLGVRTFAIRTTPVQVVGPAAQ